MKNARKFLHAFFTLFMIGVGTGMPLFLQPSIKLFEFLPLPLMSRWFFLLIPFALSVATAIMWLTKLGLYGEIIEDNNQEALRDLSIQETYKITTSDIIVSMIGIVMLDIPINFLTSWGAAHNYYHYAVLVLYAVPFISALLEFISPITIYNCANGELQSKIIKNTNICGLVTMIAMLCNFFMLIWVAEMYVCRWTFILYTIVLIFRFIMQKKIFNEIWPTTTERVVSEIDEKEGIA